MARVYDLRVVDRRRYGYLFAALSAVVVVIFLVTVYRAKRVMDEECLRLLSEIEKEDDDDSPAK